MLTQVVQQALPFTYHLHESAMGAEIFFVGLQVLGDLIDTFSEQGDLTFDGARIRCFSTKISEDL